MASLTPFDRDEWTERHPAPASRARPQRRHRSRLPVLLAIAVVGMLAFAVFEIAADWVRAS